MLFLLSFFSFLIFEPFGFPISLATLGLGLSRTTAPTSFELPSSLDRAVFSRFKPGMMFPIAGMDVVEPCLRVVIEMRRARR